MQPAHYYRQSKSWSKWIGKTGRVVGATLIRVAPPKFSRSAPYPLVIVEFSDPNSEKTQHTFVGVGHEIFQIGDEVKCVLRRMGQVNQSGLIPYGIKVKKTGGQ